MQQLRRFQLSKGLLNGLVVVAKLLVKIAEWLYMCIVCILIAKLLMIVSSSK